ncbi:MAG: TetR/AcrR family transcriptional regulator [Bacteroidota bacterium]
MQSTKQKIQDAAARLFRKKGYNGTSMKDIAQAVDIKAASIYNHFSSKQELLQNLLFDMANFFVKGMKEITTSTLNTEQQLEQLITLHIRATVEHTNAVALIAGEWIHLEEVTKMEYIQLRDQYENEFEALINKGKEEGKFVDVDTEIILFSTLSTLRWLYSWYSKNRDYNFIELERQMKICLIEGIKR